MPTKSSAYKCDFYFTDTTQRKNNYQLTAATLLNHHHQVLHIRRTKTKMMRETLGSVEASKTEEVLEAEEFVVGENEVID